MPNNDLIRLSDLLKYPIRADHYDKENGNEHFIYGIETVLEYAQNLPRVDAEPIRHGKYGWVGMDMLAGTRSFYYGTCSECKERINFAYEHKNYCPNCGAKLENQT